MRAARIPHAVAALLNREDIVIGRLGCHVLRIWKGLSLTRIVKNRFISPRDH